MKRLSQYSVVIPFMVSIMACKSYSKYTIDDHAIVKSDSGLFGIWKAIEDTDKANFILVQSPYDLFHPIEWFGNLDSLDNIKKRALESIKKRANIAERIEDTEMTKMFFDIYKDTNNYNRERDDFIKRQNFYYYITYFNRHGRNPYYQQWTSFLSKINNATFLNIPYRYTPSFYSDGAVDGPNVEGYFFVRLIKINATYDTITTAVVADTTLKTLYSSKEVRNRVAKNVNNPAFYSDTLHFYKLNGYHLTLNDAVLKAN